MKRLKTRPKPHVHEIDLSGQVSKKYEVTKALNTTEPSGQSESIC